MQKHVISRRRFLRGAALGAAAVTIQPILSSRPLYAANPGIPGRTVVVINCFGGNDGLNMVVPTTLQPYVDRRPNINLVETANLPANESLQLLNSNYSLHYSLKKLRAIWDDDDLHVVHKVSYPSPNQSHFTSMDIMSYGIRDNEANGDGRGWLGRFADLYCASPVEPLGVIAVGVGRRRDFESDVTAPLILNNIAGFDVQRDNEAGQDGALRERVNGDILVTEPLPPADPALTILNTSKQAYELVERVQSETASWEALGEGGNPGTPYPNNQIGRNLRTVSQLLYAQGSFGTKVIYTGISGFDTHSVQHDVAGNSRHERLMEQLDGALGVFAEDMKAQAKWNGIVVIVNSEFGRRVFENGARGTDHGWANPWLVAGGNVKGENVAGGITGAILESDLALPNNTLPWDVDFRDVYGNVLATHLGLPNVPQLFPDPGYTPSSSAVDAVF